MIRWFLGTLGVLLIFGSVFGGGVYVGKLMEANVRLGGTVELLRDEVKSAADRGAEDAARAAELNAGRDALDAWMKANTARRVDIAGELRRALDAMDLGLCTLSPDVQRVRTRAYQEVVDASRDSAGAGGASQAGAGADRLPDAGTASPRTP